MQKSYFLSEFQAQICTRTKFQLEILTINMISGIAYFFKIILESSRNISETTPRYY